MAATKRIIGNYTIESSGGTITLGSAGGADPVSIPGDLTVTGTTTFVHQTDMFIADNTITLNYGEGGTGVSPGGTGSAGIEIDRGLATNATLLYNDNTERWEIDDGLGGGGVAIATGVGTLTDVIDDTTPQLGGTLDVRGLEINTSNLSANRPVALQVPSGNTNDIMLTVSNASSQIILKGPTVLQEPDILIISQDETDYDGSGDNGTFVGGNGIPATSDHVALDVLTLSNGATITVDTVVSGDVTEFTVLTIGNSVVTGDTLTQTGTTGSGAAFTLTPEVANTTDGAGTELTHGTDTGGGTEILFDNGTTSGELVSKTKAMVFGLIF